MTDDRRRASRRDIVERGYISRFLCGFPAKDIFSAQESSACTLLDVSGAPLNAGTTASSAARAMESSMRFERLDEPGVLKSISDNGGRIEISVFRARASRNATTAYELPMN